MEIIIRKASVDDKEILTSLSLSFWEGVLQKDPYYEGSITIEECRKLIQRALHDDNCCLLVAEVESKIIGYVEIWLANRDFYFIADNYAYINGIYVKDDYRVAKISLKLYRKAEEWVLSQNLKYLVADVSAYNEKVARALHFYGFKTFRTRLVKSL